MLKSLLLKLFSGTVRRLIVTIIGILATLLHEKLGIELTPEAQASIAAMVIGYLFQSSTKEAAIAKAEASKPAPLPAGDLAGSI